MLIIIILTMRSLTTNKFAIFQLFYCFKSNRWILKVKMEMKMKNEMKMMTSPCERTSFK